MGQQTHDLLGCIPIVEAQAENFRAAAAKLAAGLELLNDPPGEDQPGEPIEGAAALLVAVMNLRKQLAEHDAILKRLQRFLWAHAKPAKTENGQ